MFNADMTEATSTVRATVRNDLVHELRHRVSFATGQLLRLLTLINLCRRSATSCDGVW